jgi:Spy/CpxP family protein refolding chaperone
MKSEKIHEQESTTAWRRQLSVKNTPPILLIGLTVFLSLTITRCTRSPYVSQKMRDIKALSPEDINGYLDGQGMGLAKGAELNSYPGPLHVLELSEKLELTAEQRERTEAIYDRMHGEAVRLGKLIVEGEAELDTLFSAQTIDEEQLFQSISEISRLEGELRYVHLRAHLHLKEVLSTEQVTSYNRLRGYSSDGGKRKRLHQRHEHD